ncbi:DUF3239 domain-containing protein [Flavobacterium sp. CBA20B-1]|uniref:DUF3239 domain-containing protein n=1 Tax=unclassified Flavobacterium TaxID=196869 RepID=UPI002225A27A|nr:MULTISPECIES: DUF3239 domain-containing protein [unclassified Flavobacterium]WCM41912.1 DUF3239 domain-containing protein [Flavobacterium sp. CBA20B-1]
MNQDKKIGQKEKMINLTSVSRSMNIEPDSDHINRYDEYPAKLTPFFYVAIVLASASAVATFMLFSFRHWILGSIFLITTFVLGMLVQSLRREKLRKRIIYQNCLLIPAILIKIRPLTILALADMRSNDSKKMVWGCQKLTIKKLPFHQLQVDERVPCVSLFGMVVKGYRRHFEPRPISWGFVDELQRKKVLESIDELEWRVLEKLQPKMNGANEKEVVFFDCKLNKINL